MNSEVTAEKLFGIGNFIIPEGQFVIQPALFQIKIHTHTESQFYAVKHSNGDRYKRVFEPICPASWQSISVT